MLVFWLLDLLGKTCFDMIRNCVIFHHFLDRSYFGKSYGYMANISCMKLKRDQNASQLLLVIFDLVEVLRKK